jgi:uncharacterized protein YjbI with pentapeptide repeats
MADDAQRLSALEKAVNDSAGKAGVLWTSFITLGTYLLIATGSVTHRNLFLNSGIKLPVLGVELPVTGYFLVAPMIFLIFHFYLLLQLEGLSEKVVDYNLVLNETMKAGVDRRRARWRLDDFPFLQFLAGVRERRTGIAGKLQILISWITIVLFPIVVLLQLQIAFLPYHSESVTWLHRACLIGDLGLIWFFWHAFRRNSERSRRRRVAVAAVEIVGTLLVLIFSLALATFPGEAMYRNAVATAVDAVVSFAFRDQAVSASRYFFEGDVDGVTGQPASLFANRIILPGERFHDETKKTEVSVALRGRNLRGAILQRTDLSFADFTGAVLVEASFAGAKLHRARFGCAAKLRLKMGGRSSRIDSCDDERAADLRGADFTEAALHGVFFNHAKLHGARFSRAMMQGMSADDADLSGASFTYARLEGSSFVGATLVGASFSAAQMQGADLSTADLSNATLFRTQLQGARLQAAELTNATLQGVNLYRSFVNIADHQETAFVAVHAGPTFPSLQTPSARKERDSRSAPKTLDPGGYKALVSRAQEQIQIDEVKLIVAVRLLALDPARDREEDQMVTDKPIKSEADVIARIRGQRAEALAKLMCEAEGAPYVVRGFIYGGRIRSMVSKSAAPADDPALRAIALLRGTECPGAVGLDVNDLRELSRLERQVQRAKNPTDADDDDDNVTGVSDKAPAR